MTTSTGWLWLLAGFMLPLFVFVAAVVFMKPRPVRLMAAAGGAALVPALAVWLIIFSSPYWREGTQIAWTGVKATGSPLAIGGKAEEMVVGWPNGTREPRLILSRGAAGGSQASLELKGGGAFVFDERRQQLLNGNFLPVGATTPLGDYQIRVNKLGLSLSHPFSHEIEVLDRDGRPLVGFSLRKNRTRPLRLLIAAAPVGDVDSLASDAERERAVTDRQSLEEWAADVWLYRQDNSGVQVLTRGLSYSHNIEGSSKLSVKWPDTTLTFDTSVASLSDGTTQEQLSFNSPWRLTSPLPPEELAGCGNSSGVPSGDLRLIVTGSASPCDTAFVLPLSGDTAKLREEVTISPEWGKFTGDAVDNEKPRSLPPGVIDNREKVGTSQVSRTQGAYTFDLATVRNLPSRPMILSLLLVAWLIYLLGLTLAYPRMVETNRVVVYGLSLVAWNFLCFRLLLSFRYALDPASLDSLAVEGVTLAFVGLAVVPGIVLLIGRLRADRYDGPVQEPESRNAMLLALGYLGLLIAGGLTALHAPARLWSALPDKYYLTILDYLSSWSGLVFFVIVAAASLLLAFHIRFLYVPDDSKGATKGALSRAFVSPWYWLENYFAGSDEFWEARLRSRFKLLFLYFLGGAIIFAVYVVLFWMARKFLPGDKTAQEMSVPLFFYCLTVLWLGLRLFFISKENDKPLNWHGHLMLAASAVLMLTLPAVFLPIFIGDFGSIIPILAIVLPLTWLLIVILPTKARLSVALAVGLIFAGGFMLYKNVEGLIPFEKQIVSALPFVRYVPGAEARDRFFARLLNYKQGSGAQRLAVNANSMVGGEGLQYQELLNGNEHMWENRAIANYGNWAGLGFGRAPTRESNVRQDTLQYDSVFSFFVVSEFGMAGGTMLMLMYAVPLILVFIGGRSRFDGGYAIAYVVTSAFFLEGLYHMGMNLGAFPLTGRNLPLLSVNSPTDLIRWTLLFSFAVTAIFWRYKGHGSFSDSPSLISHPAARTAPGTSSAAVFASARGEEPLLRYALIFWVVPLLFAAAVLSSGLGVMSDSENKLKTYNYKPILDDVNFDLRDGVIEFDAASGRLKLDKSRLEDPDVGSFIQNQITLFNAENQVEKQERFRKKYIDEINSSLSAAKTLREYNDALMEIGRRSPPEARRNIFRLKITPDEDGDGESVSVEANRDFNVNFSFRENNSKAALVNVKYGDELMIGPTWVNGRVYSVVRPDAKMPWAALLRDAVAAETARAVESGADPSKVATDYGRLTLDPALHEAAADFVAAKGVGLHESFLSSPNTEEARGKRAYIRNLPPRIALSVLDLADGKTLALGGWPRMTSSSRQWLLSSLKGGDDAKSFWEPTMEWLDREAPAAINARYGGDRNFDHGFVMGSSTKPIWAAAILRSHPKLTDLKVLGATGEESSAFGVTIPGKAWHLNSHETDWVDLTTYLKTSDNRYHVRLGLLGLALDDTGTAKAAGPSGSQVESLTGGREPWGMYPEFVPPFKVKKDGNRLEMYTLVQNPGNQLPANSPLADSPLAQNLRGMFSVNVKRVDRERHQVSEFGPRRSFWTKDERDDLTGVAPRDSTPFDRISPLAPDFGFDEPTRPRDYISMLFGGGKNAWANVDLAAAFGSCLLGRPVLAHVVDNNLPLTPLDGRKLLDPAVAAKLRDGLAAVVESNGGTAYKVLHGNETLSALKGAGVKVYAKTGTLRADEEEIVTSRIVLALVKWKNEEAGEVESGLVFSLVVEEGGGGKATTWLGDFMNQNKDEIFRLLKIQATQPASPRR